MWVDVVFGNCFEPGLEAKAWKRGEIQGLFIWRGFWRGLVVVKFVRLRNLLEVMGFGDMVGGMR